MENLLVGGDEAFTAPAVAARERAVEATARAGTGVEAELREWQQACGYGDDQVEDALAACNLTARRDVHPYDLSGGQQQMLALYKLLLTDPDLLLLDEPTKGLDPQSRIAVAGVLVDFARNGGTVILATHDLAFTASVSDMASMVFDGQVACTEPAQAFFANNLFYRPVPDAFTAIPARRAADAAADGTDGAANGEGR